MRQWDLGVSQQFSNMAPLLTRLIGLIRFGGLDSILRGMSRLWRESRYRLRMTLIPGDEVQAVPDSSDEEQDTKVNICCLTPNGLVGCL